MLRSFRVTRFVVAFGLIALVAACSFTRFGYNQADTVAAWMADEYFDLDAQQKQDFRTRFERVYTWHRSEQLPEYAAFMRSAKARVQQGLSRDDVLWFVEGIRSRVRIAAQKAAPETAAFLATLTPAQIQALQRKWDKDNKKYVKEHKVDGTPEERQEYEAKRVVKTFKEWLTPLNSEQEQRVTAMVRDLPPIEPFRYAERLRRQKEFLAVLAQRSEDRAKFTARVSDWLTHWEHGRTPDEQKKLDTWWVKRAEIFAALDKMITPEQRSASLQRMQGYAEDFTQLARAGDASRTAAR